MHKTIHTKYSYARGNPCAVLLFICPRVTLGVQKSYAVLSSTRKSHHNHKNQQTTSKSHGNHTNQGNNFATAYATAAHTNSSICSMCSSSVVLWHMNVDRLICTTSFYPIPRRVVGTGAGAGSQQEGRQICICTGTYYMHMHGMCMCICMACVYVHMHGMCMRLGAAFGA